MKEAQFMPDSRKWYALGAWEAIALHRPITAKMLSSHQRAATYRVFISVTFPLLMCHFHIRRCGLAFGIRFCYWQLCPPFGLFGMVVGLRKSNRVVNRCIATMLATQTRHDGGVEPPQPGL